MLSRISKSFLKSTFNTSRANFASLNIKKTILDVLNRQDIHSPHYKIASVNPVNPIEGQKWQTRQNQESNYEVTKLKNGITVVTESSRFPSVVDMGILLDVGTRDETHETSGSLLSIRSTYYKTVLNTNETINYGMVQMSGGEFNMEYDQENTYFNAHCLSHDAVDIFNMMADAALEPRSVVAANAAMDKINFVHELEEYLGTDRRFNDHLLATAFGNHGLGMPLLGNPHNKKYLFAHVLQKFQLENINPNRIFVGAAGVENHQEFVELVESKLSFIPSVQGSAPSREASEYVGGEQRTNSDSNEVTIGLAFRSAPWKSSDIFALQVVNTLLGSTASYSIGGAVPASSNHRTARNLLNKLNYVDSAHAINFNFSDNGLFGLAIAGSASHATDLLEAVTGELKGLTHNISADELNRAKANAKNNILVGLQRQKDRLEEATKNVKNYGKVVMEEYANQIDKVTADQIASVIGASLSSRPTLVVEGGDATRLPSLDRIENMVKP